MNVRRLGPDDAKAFCRLRAAGLRESPGAFGASPDEDVSADLEKARALLQPELEDAVFGAFDSSSSSSSSFTPLIGVVGLHRATHAKALHHGSVWGMYVAPEARGRGAAAGLLEKLIAHAETLAGLDWLQLGVGSDNGAARAVYEGFGFRGWGVERDALRVNGEPVHELHMALRLTPAAAAGKPSAAARLMSGRCLCGGVRFEIRQRPGPLELCHCTRCRRVSGSAFVAGLKVATAGYRMTRGRELVRSFSLPVVEVPPAYTTFFCERCGSPVPEPEPREEHFEIPAGLLDGDPGITADRHIFTEHRAPWFETDGLLPELDRAAVIRLRFGERKRPVDDDG